MSEQAIIQNQDLVLLHMTIKLPDGSVADSTKVQGQPIAYLVGSAEISEAFDQQLLGKTVPSDLSFHLSAKEALGDGNPDLIHYMDLSQFSPELNLEVGNIVSFTQPNGGEIPGLIRDVQGESVKVDFNHPLVGQDLTFELQLLEIKVIQQ